MGTSLNAWHEVAAPPVVPYRFGVFSVAEPRTATGVDLAPDEHWRLGLEWISEACRDALVTSGPCIDPEVGPLESNRECNLFQFEPFTVYAFNTDALPGRTVRQHEANAVARLTNGEQAAVESVLWSRFVAATPVPTSLTSVPGWVGLGWMEQALAEQYGSQGVIHMSRLAATALGLYLRPDGGVLRTLLGTPVVAGGGYDALQAVQGDTAAIFGTGPLVMYRGDIDTRENAVDLALNDVSIVAQRDYALGWDCVTIGAEISLGCGSAGAG